MASLIILLLVVGGILFILPHLPIDDTVKLIIKVIVIVGTAIYALKYFLPMVL